MKNEEVKSMKHFKRIIASVIILAICVGLGYATGLSLEEFIDNIHINLESVLKVAIIIAFLLAVKHILKFLINLIHIVSGQPFDGGIQFFL